MNGVALGASILTADLLCLRDEIARAESAGIDFFHMDIMDGVFVPNITFGPMLVEAVRQATSLPLDVHLMIQDPERHIKEFAQAGADIITVHIETSTHLNATLTRLRELDVVPGVTLNPATPLNTLEEVLPIIGQVLIMSVNPGFGGQSFIPAALNRISRTRIMIQEQGLNCMLEVDGGVKRSNIRKIVQHGADSLVVGSGIFNDNETAGEAIAALKAEIATAGARSRAD